MMLNGFLAPPSYGIVKGGKTPITYGSGGDDEIYEHYLDQTTGGINYYQVDGTLPTNTTATPITIKVPHNGVDGIVIIDYLK